jgi:transposase-like protein
MEARRKFTKEFKLEAVQRLRAGEPVGAVARRLEVNRQDLYRWSRALDKFGGRAFPGVGQKREEETRLAELERKIGQQVLEIDFLSEPCSVWKNSASCGRRVATHGLRTGRARSDERNATDDRRNVPAGDREPGRILSGCARAPRGGNKTA